MKKKRGGGGGVKKRKNGAHTEMGFYPFEHKAGLGTGLGMGCAGVHDKDKRWRVAQHKSWARGTSAWGPHRSRACGARSAQALGGHAGCRLEAWARRLGCELCTWCTQPVPSFDSVLFLSQFFDTVHRKKISRKFFFN